MDMKTNKIDQKTMDRVLKDIDKASSAINRMLERHKSGVYQRCYGCGCMILPMEKWTCITSHDRNIMAHTINEKKEFWHGLCWDNFSRSAELVDGVSNAELFEHPMNGDELMKHINSRLEKKGE